MIVARKFDFGVLVMDEASGDIIADFAEIRFPTPHEIAAHPWFREASDGGRKFRFAVWGVAPDAQAKLLSIFRLSRVIRVADLGASPPLHVCVVVSESEEDAVGAMEWLRARGYAVMPAEPGMEESPPRLPGRRPLPGVGMG